MLNKEKELNKMKKEMLADTKLAFSSNLIIGDGDLNADIVFIGEAPGKTEDETGIPFVGRSGKVLETSLIEIGIKRSDVYITNIVKRRPPNNRDPKPAEIEAYSVYLKRQLDIIKPKIVVSLGRFSWNYFNSQGKISQDQGHIFNLEKHTFTILPIYHPAAILYNPRHKDSFKKSFKVLKEFLDKD